jgi:hypothetical protein
LIGETGETGEYFCPSTIQTIMVNCTRRVQTINGTTTGNIDQNHAAESSIIVRDDHGLAGVRYESMH